MTSWRNEAQNLGGSMKIFLIALLSFFTQFAFAEEPVPAFAEMSCDIYSTRIENSKLKESTLLVSNKGKVFELGMAQWLVTTLPVPYQDISVSFNHYLSYYNEVPKDSIPYLEAYFERNKSTSGGSRINFDIKNPEVGSKILLRSTYKFSPEVLLSYRCNLFFKK